jgi:hypothetical protein
MQDGNAVCDKLIPVEKCSIMPRGNTRAAIVPFNEQLRTQIDETTMAKEKRRSSTREQIKERVRIARDMIAAGADNKDIYRETQEKTGHSIGANILSTIRSGSYRGWGAELLNPTKRDTSDAPSERVNISAAQVVKGASLKQALRLVSAAMREEQIAKLCIFDDGRVKASYHQTKEWTLD